MDFGKIWQMDGRSRKTGTAVPKATIKETNASEMQATNQQIIRQYKNK